MGKKRKTTWECSHEWRRDFLNFYFCVYCSVWKIEDTPEWEQDLPSGILKANGKEKRTDNDD